MAHRVAWPRTHQDFFPKDAKMEPLLAARVIMLDDEGVKAKLSIVGVAAVQEEDVTATVGPDALNLTLER
jgi:hypothetical protein